MTDTYLGALTLVATLREQGEARGVDVDVEVRLESHLKEMLAALSASEAKQLMALRRQVARAATDFFVFLHDPDSKESAGI